MTEYIAISKVRENISRKKNLIRVFEEQYEQNLSTHVTDE
jgi:hypothetical protein